MNKVLGTNEFETFLEKVNAITHDEYTVGVDVGRKYARIHTTGYGQTGAYGFVDLTNGDVLKAAGWKAPAKHARGNIFNDDNGASALDRYGVRYLR